MIGKYLSSLLLLLCGSFVFGQQSNAGLSLFADFDGDYSREYAFIIQTKSPTIDSTGKTLNGSYSVIFSIAKLGEIDAGCCDINLILEGDLNQDGAAELSICKDNGTDKTITTYSFNNAKWEVLVPSFSIAKSGISLTNEQLSDCVFLKDGSIYIRNGNGSSTRKLTTSSEDDLAQ